VDAVKAIVRGFSYVYHTLLALFLVAVGGLALATAPQSLHLDMLPWTGSTLALIVFFGAIVGLITVVLALKGVLRPLFFLWCLLVTVLMVRGFFFSGFRFEPGGSGPKMAAYLVVGSFLALLGGWWQMMRRVEKRRF
jgi:hypothetical protein